MTSSLLVSTIKRLLNRLFAEDSLFKSASFLVIADMAAKGGTGVLALLIARYLGPSLYGQYAIASSVGGLFMMLTSIGFEQEFTRRGGIDDRNVPRALSLNLSALLLTSFVAYGGMAVFLAVSPYDPTVIFLTLILAIALIANRFQYVFRHLGLVWDRSDVAAVIQGGTTVLLLASTLLAMLAGEGLVTIVAIQLVVSLVGLAGWYVWLPARTFDFQGITWDGLIRFTKKSVPYGLSSIIWIAYFNFDAFILSLLRTESEVGLYAGVYRIVAVSYIVGYASANTFTPRLFEAHEKDRTRYVSLARTLAGVAGALSIIVGGGLYVFSGWLIPLIIGSSYADGITIMKILSVAAVFRLLNFGMSELLTTSDRQLRRVLAAVREHD